MTTADLRKLKEISSRMIDAAHTLAHDEDYEWSIPEMHAFVELTDRILDISFYTELHADRIEGGRRGYGMQGRKEWEADQPD